MLLAILLALQILGNCLMCVESIDDLEEIYDPDNEVDIVKRVITLSDVQVNKLIDIYDKASVANFSFGNVIPDPRCSIPFDYWVQKGSYWTEESRNIYCKNDGGTDIWCAIRKKHLSTKTDWEYCLMKGSEVADPTIWIPHPDCVPLFTYYNPKYKKDMYYKGCTNIDEEKPWCSHKYRHESGKWSFCNIKEWTKWSPWSQCPLPCGGSKTRTRMCLVYGKRSSGCPGGAATEITGCPECPINGAWSNWNPYGNCSGTVTCGTGVQILTRKCDNPEPKYGGQDCDTDNVRRDPCKLAECPVEEDKEDDFKKMSSQNGYGKIIFPILGSLGGLILIVGVIAAVMVRRKKKRFGPAASSNTGQSGIVYQESERE